MTSSGWLSTDVYLGAIDRDAAVMIDILAATDLAADVPSCPGWTLRDLIVHTGQVHRQKAETVRGGWVDESPPRPGPPDTDLESWFSEGVDDLLDVLSTADLSQPSWTWCGHDHTARWWVRRMAHETTIHAADAVLVAGGQPMLETDLAADGVDEILIEMMTDGPSWGTVVETDRVVALHVDEGDRDPWTLRTAEFSGTSPSSGTTYAGLDTFVLVSDGEPDATIRADASALDLWLWGRGPLDASAVDGEADLADHVRRVAAEATG